jgi:hypothetical protein
MLYTEKTAMKDAKWILRFFGAVLVELVQSNGTGRKRPVRAVKPSPDDGDELIEQVQKELRVSLTVNDREYLPDMGVPPEKQF